jgi:hypothetical protein
MRTIHNLLWLTTFGVMQAGCSGAVFIAEMPDGGSDSGEPGPGSGDTGVAENDTGTDALDTGTASSDTGASPGDTGTGSNDTGTNPSDTGTGSSDSGKGSGDTGTGIVSCSTNRDCPANQTCGFLESVACAARGQCFASPGLICQSYSAGCACDGSEINIACTGLPTGYGSKPLSHSGPCVDAATTKDSGTTCTSAQGGPCGGNTSNPCTCESGLVCTPGTSGPPAGDVGGTCQPADAGGSHTACTTAVDCGPSEICGFATSAGCVAQGQCFVSPAAHCLAYALGCACDGSAINIACTGLPGGYETKPFLHTGSCTGVADGG